MALESNRIYLVTYYFDGIRSGVANNGSEPVYFEEEFNHELEDYTGVFRLKSLDNTAIMLAEEACQCEERYYTEYLSGRPVPEGSPRVLEKDKVRYTEIMDKLKMLFEIDTIKCIKAKAVFHSQPSEFKRTFTNIKVQWLISE
jgi:hypothetical protein